MKTHKPTVPTTTALRHIQPSAFRLSGFSPRALAGALFSLALLIAATLSLAPLARAQISINGSNLGDNVTISNNTDFTFSQVTLAGASGTFTVSPLTPGDNLIFDSLGANASNRLAFPSTAFALTFLIDPGASLTFAGNVSSSAGGAINVGVGSVLRLLPAAGATYIFQSNTSTGTGNGGAIATAGANTYIEINNTLFKNNTSGGNGGAVQFGVTSTMTINSSTFIGNYAAGTGNGAGALFGNGATAVINLNDVLFKGNRVNPAATTGHGGAIFYNGNSTTLTATNVIFDSNTTGNVGGGGGIFIGANPTTLTLTSGTFVNNWAGTTGGGAVGDSAANANMTFDTVTFKNNTTTGPGGAIYLAGNSSTITAINSLFVGNSASGYGGVIFNNIANNVTLNLTNVSFLDNTSASLGGAIASLNNVNTNGKNFTVNLTTTTGTSRFAGNKGSAGSNSIHLILNTVNAGNINSGSITVDTQGASVLDMLDPITTDLAGSGGVDILKKGTGTWNLDGATTIAKAGNTSPATFTIAEGTLHLYRAGVDIVDPRALTPKFTTVGGSIMFTSNANQAVSFTLKSPATLSIGGGNTISMVGAANASLIFEQGSTLLFDLNNITPGGSSLLTLSGNPATLQLIGAAATGQFNSTINLGYTTTPALGQYTLLTYTGKLGTLDAAGLTALQTGAYYGAPGVNLDALHALGLQAKFGNDANSLWVTFSNYVSMVSNVLTWTNGGDGNWAGTGNWTLTGATTPATFAAGDIVNFDSTSTAPATLTQTATAAAIYVGGAANHAITGEGLATDPNHTGLEGSAVTGKLVLGKNANAAAALIDAPFTATLDLTGQNATPNNFTGGVDIYTGTLRVSTAGQLGAGLANYRLLSTPADAAAGNTATIRVAPNATSTPLTLTGPGATSPNHLTLSSSNVGLFVIEDGATLTFASNTAATGGAINITGTGASLTLRTEGPNARLNFTNNYGSTSGGAIYLASNATLTIDASAGAPALFSQNSSNGRGGAIDATYYNTVTITNAIFDQNNNTAGTANAGAIAAIQNSKLTLTNVLFTSNTTNGLGGALFINTSSTLTVTNGTFAGNYSANTAAAGGAIAVQNANTAGIPASVLIATDLQFYGNSSAAGGGAISSNTQGAYQLNLNVSDNKTSQFAGNTSGLDTAATPNSIYMAGNTTLTLNIGANARLDMLDPITTADLAVTISQTGPGIWNLGGASKLGASTNITINNASTLHLYRAGEQTVTNPITAATYDSTAGSITINGGSFTLKDAATLSAGGANTITAPAITLADNSALVLDLTNATPTTGLSTDYSVLTLNSPALTANWNLLSLDLLNIGSMNTTSIVDTGTYNLITLLGGGLFTGAGPDTFATLTGNNSYTVQLDSTKSIFQLVYVAMAIPNNVLNWTGANGNSWGSTTLNNWVLASDNLTGTTFRQGDIINLAATAPLANSTLNVDTTTSATITGMYVSGNQSYTITGTTITAVATGVGTFSGSYAATGKLILGASAAPDASSIDETPASAYTGVLTLSNTSAGGNNFTGGIVIHNGALVGNDQTLNTGGAGSPGIINDGTLTLNQTTTGTYAAPITNTNPAAVLNKTGAAALVLTANNTYTGTTNINAGSLILGTPASALASSLINVNSTGTLGGIGKAGGNVNVNSGGALMVGLTHADPAITTSQTLAIGGALAIHDGATLFYDIYSGNQSDLITGVNFTSAVTTAHSATLTLNAATPGTYKLASTTGGITTLGISATDAFATTLNGAPLPGRTAASYSILNTGLDLYLTLANSNTNLTWLNTTAANTTWDNTGAINWSSPVNPAEAFLKGDSVTFAATTGTITIAEPVAAADMTAGATGTLTFAGPGAITTSTAAADTNLATATGKLTINNTGLVILANTATNNFTTGIAITSGTLQGNTNTLATAGTTTISTGAALVYNQPAATTGTARDITGAGSLAQIGPGALTLAGTTDYTGPTTLAAGALTLANANQIISSTAVTLAASTTLNTGANPQTLNHLSGTGNVVTTAGGDLTLYYNNMLYYSGAISGAANVTKTGLNNLYIRGNNTFTGTFTIAAGTVILGVGTADGTVDSSIPIVVNSSLWLSHGATSSTMANLFSGNGYIRKVNDTGTLTLTADSSAYTGTTIISQGALNLASTAKLGGITSQLILDSGAALAGNGAIGGNVTAAGNNTITVYDTNLPSTASQTLTIGGTLTLGAGFLLNYTIAEPSASDLLKVGALDIKGTGTVNLAPTLTKSGTYKLIASDTPILTTATSLFTTLNGYAILSDRIAPTYYIDAANNLMLDLTMTNAAILWDGTNTGQWAVGQTNWKTNNIFMNGDTVTFDDTAYGTHAVAVDTAGVAPANMTITTTTGYTFTGGPITTTGSLLLNGPGLVDLQNATNTFTNGITIASGTLQGTAAALAVGPTGTLTNNATLVFNQTTSATYSAPIVGATGTLVKQAAGALTLDNPANDYTGGIKVLGGALNLTALDTAKLGAMNIAAGALNLTKLAALTVTKPLTGTGTLSINLTTPAGLVDLTGAGNQFAGTVNLGTSAYNLNNANLANATLALGSGNTTTVTGAQTTKNLAIDGATVDFTAGTIQTTNLTLGATGTVKVAIPLAPALLGTGTSLFAQASGTVVAKLVTATGQTTGDASAAGWKLLDQTGNAVPASGTAAIGTAATGTYGYGLTSTSGLNVSYKLTGLTINPGQTLTLTPSAAEGTFNATIAGAANTTLDINATTPGATTVTLAKDNTGFTGATTLTAGTLTAGANNALGSTASLTQAATTTYNLGAFTQTLGALTTTAATATTTIATGGKLTVTNATNYAGALANAGLATLAGPATLGTVNNTGTLAANNTATITGLLTNNGLATITGSSALAAVTNIGTLNLAAATITGALNNSGPLNATAPVAFNGAVTTTAPITLAAGAAFASTLAGSGALNLTGGTTSVSSANTGYTGATTIAAPATLDLNNAAALGSTGTISNAGTLNLNAPGTFANPLTGTGAFNIKGTGNTAVTGAGNYSGPVTIAPSAIVSAENLAALGSGSIANSGVITHTGTGALVNNITGGILNLNPTGTINVTGNNNVGTINIAANSTIVASSPTALQSGTLKAETASTLVFAAITNNLNGAVILNSATAVFANVAGAIPVPSRAGGAAAAIVAPAPYKTANLGSLTGNGVSGFVFNTNLGAGDSDKLNIAGSASGEFTVAISNTGGAPAEGAAPITIVTYGAGSTAHFTGSDSLDLGGTYRTNWYVSTDSAGAYINTERGTALGPIGGAIIANATASLPLTWFTELDTLSKRLGDLHIMNRETPGADLWLRGYTQRLNVNNKDTAVAFDETQYGTEVGLDYGGHPTGYGAAMYAGVFLGYGASNRHIDDAHNSTGDTTSVHGGAYVTVNTPSGWYVDIVGKYNRFKNQFTATTDNADVGYINGDYNVNAFGASVEAGKRIELGANWYVTPGAQAALARINAADYNTTTANEATNHRVNQSSITSRQLRAGALLGYKLVTKTAQVIQPYVKAYAAQQWTNGGAIDIYGQQSGIHEMDTNTGAPITHYSTIKGRRMEAGVGVNWQIMKTFQVYFDYDCAWARDYTKPYGLTLGASYAW